MLEVAIKVLAVIAGIWAAFASYPYLNQHVFALLALIGAIAVGVIVGYLVWAALNWVLGSVNRTGRV